MKKILLTFLYSTIALSANASSKIIQIVKKIIVSGIDFINLQVQDLELWATSKKALLNN
tara:strand:- start:15721 stop:15897 length:177 start_codon:yes stop_codon:yes gene_type:complete